jgi:hypothetical protein
MFPRTNILVVEPAQGQNGNVTSCLKMALVPCSLAVCGLDDALFLANRYDFDLIAFDPGIVGDTAALLAAVVKAIKPHTLVVALVSAVSPPGNDGPSAKERPGLDARLAMPGQCHLLAGMVRAATRLTAFWAA